VKIEATHSPETVAAELGRRIARRRLERGMSQAALAEAAGLGKRTVERMESGGDGQVSSLLRLLRALSLLEGVDGLVPEAGPRPIDLLKLHGRERKRARGKRTDKKADRWRWGDEQ